MSVDEKKHGNKGADWVWSLLKVVKESLPAPYLSDKEFTSIME